MIEYEILITKLKQELERERATVDFYANEFNWTTHKEDHLCRLDTAIKNDRDTYGELNDENESVLVCVGGKLARETQSKRSED